MKPITKVFLGTEIYAKKVMHLTKASAVFEDNIFQDFFFGFDKERKTEFLIANPLLGYDLKKQTKMEPQRCWINSKLQKNLSWQREREARYSFCRRLPTPFL